MANRRKYIKGKLATIYLDKDVLERAKVFADKERVSFSEVINIMLKNITREKFREELLKEELEIG